MQKTFYTIWSYMTRDYNDADFQRVIFFYAGSINYNGSWMGPSDCVIMIPNLNDWEC